MKIEGLAIRWEAQAKIGEITETMLPGAFASSIQNQDVLALRDHNPSELLGRTGSGTLSMRETAEGLAFALQLPNSPGGIDAYENAKLGNLKGVSIGFFLPGSDYTEDGGKRTIHRADLREISLLGALDPAYAGTRIQARSNHLGKTEELRCVFLGGEISIQKKNWRLIGKCYGL